MKIKKLICILLIIMLVMGANTSAVSAKADTDEADLCLMEAVRLMVDEEIETIDYTRRYVYDLSLKPIGYEYETLINGKESYVLMVNTAGYYEVTELYISKNSPFKGIVGKPIYATLLTYLEYIDGNYRDLETDIILNDEQLNFLRNKGFGYADDELYLSDSDLIGTLVKETVVYDSRKTEKGAIPSALPVYFNENSDYKNMCAVNAGSVVVGYYSRYYPQLTPNFNVGIKFGDSYFYLYDKDGAMQDIIIDLYGRMKTNVGGAGTSAMGFRSGLQSYVNAKGLNVSYTSLCTNNSLNYSKYKTQINNKTPVVLFFDGFNNAATPNTTSGKTDTLERKKYIGTHVMIGYGFETYEYYKNNALFRTDYFLQVYSGLKDCPLGYVKLYSDSSILMEAYAINIY